MKTETEKQKQRELTGKFIQNTLKERARVEAMPRTERFKNVPMRDALIYQNGVLVSTERRRWMEKLHTLDVADGRAPRGSKYEW